MSNLGLHSGEKQIPHFVRDDNFGEVASKVGAAPSTRQGNVASSEQLSLVHRIAPSMSSRAESAERRTCFSVRQHHPSPRERWRSSILNPSLNNASSAGRSSGLQIRGTSFHGRPAVLRLHSGEPLSGDLHRRQQSSGSPDTGASRRPRSRVHEQVPHPSSGTL